ncbi:flagellin [Paenibacillus sp. FSL M8-0212]|uniref:flagellin n=1 Tax=Paenibacillus sp. FSL M8-0212 TaxID=2921618 RepID=UPI004046F166
MKYGAYKNALEHSYNNVSNYNLNLTLDESRTRDLDMASEVMRLTQRNILSRATQAACTS